MRAGRFELRSRKRQQATLSQRAENIIRIADKGLCHFEDGGSVRTEVSQ